MFHFRKQCNLGPVSPLLSTAFSKVQMPSAQAEQPSRKPSGEGEFSQHLLKESVGAQQIETQTQNLFTFPSSSEACITGGQDSNSRDSELGWEAGSVGWEAGSVQVHRGKSKGFQLVPSVHSDEEKDTN